MFLSMGIHTNIDTQSCTLYLSTFAIFQSIYYHSIDVENHNFFLRVCIDSHILKIQKVLWCVFGLTLWSGIIAVFIDCFLQSSSMFVWRCYLSNCGWVILIHFVIVKLLAVIIWQKSWNKICSIISVTMTGLQSLLIYM